MIWLYCFIWLHGELGAVQKWRRCFQPGSLQTTHVLTVHYTLNTWVVWNENCGYPPKMMTSFMYSPFLLGDGWHHTPKTVTTTKAPAVLTQNQWNWRLHNSGEIVGGDPGLDEGLPCFTPKANINLTHVFPSILVIKIMKMKWKCLKKGSNVFTSSVILPSSSW